MEQFFNSLISSKGDDHVRVTRHSSDNSVNSNTDMLTSPSKSKLRDRDRGVCGLHGHGFDNLLRACDVDRCYSYHYYHNDLTRTVGRIMSSNNINRSLIIQLMSNPLIPSS